MPYSANQPLGGWRNEACLIPIVLPGVDLTGHAFRAQIRQSADNPVLTLDLPQTADPAATGIRFVSVTHDASGVPTTNLAWQITKAAMQALPYAGELGDSMLLAYAFQIDGVTKLFGQFVAGASPIDSDAAPANRPLGYGGSSFGPLVGSVLLTLGAGGVTVSVDGVDLLAPLIALANAQATIAGGFAHDASGAAASAAISAAAALAASNLFASTAAGLAGTAEGHFFAVPSAGDIYATLYKVTGGAAVAINTFASFGYQPLNRFVTMASLRAKMAQGLAVTGVMLGDSTTDGVNTTGWPGNHAAGDATYRPPNAYPAVLEGYLQSILKNPGVKIWNAGFSGQTTQWLLDNFDAIFANFGAVDFVVLSAGLNDEATAGYSAATYGATLTALIAKIIAHGSIPVMMSQDAIMQTATRRNEHASNEMAQIMAGAARANGLEYWDMNAAEAAHWRSNADGTLGQQATQQPDDLHGGDNVHAFKASFILTKLMPGRVLDLPLDRPTHLSAWEDAAGSIAADGTFRASNTRAGGNLYYTAPTVGGGVNLLDVLVWNPGQRTALFARMLSNNGMATGMRLKVDALSYVALPLTDALMLSDGLEQDSNTSASENAMFSCVLAHGLNRIRFTSPTVAGNVFAPAFEFYPAFPHVRAPGSYRVVSAQAPILIAETSALLASPGGGGVDAYIFTPAAVREDGRNLISVGPDANRKTRLIIETTMPAGTGLTLLDGQAWPASTSAGDLTSRTGIYLYRGFGSTTLAFGRMNYRTVDLTSTAAALNVPVASAALAWADPMTFIVDLWREAGSQRVQVTLLDGTIVLDITRANTGPSLPVGGAVGGIVNAARAVGPPVQYRHRIFLAHMEG